MVEKKLNDSGALDQRSFSIDLLIASTGGRRHTGVPKRCSASQTYLPNRNRVKHSSMFTSKTSPSSSEVACQRILC